MVSTLIHMTVKCKAIGIYMSVTTSLHRSIKFFLPSFPVAEDEYDEKCVSVMLEGEETEMVFIDHPHSEISVSRIWELPFMTSALKGGGGPGEADRVKELSSGQIPPPPRFIALANSTSTRAL